MVCIVYMTIVVCDVCGLGVMGVSVLWCGVYCIGGYEVYMYCVMFM